MPSKRTSPKPSRTVADPERCAWWAVVAAVLVVPLAFAPFAADVFMLPKLLLAAGATVIGWAAFFGATRPAPPRPHALVPVAALLAATVAATAVSATRATSLLGVYQRYGGVLPLAVFVAFAALVVAVSWDRPDRVATIGTSLGAASIAVAAYALLQRAGVDAFDFREASGGAVRYPGSTLGNSNFAGGFLAIGLPFVVSGAITAHGTRRRAVATAAIVIVAAGLWATSSRGGLVAATAGLAVAGVAGRRALPRAARPALVAGGVLAAALVVAAAIVVATGARDVPGGDLEVLRGDSARVRGFEWEAAWRAIVDRPVLGHGPDTFAVVYPQFRSAEDATALGNQLSDKPHNVLLERASDTGIVGLGAYVAVAGVVLWFAVRRPPNDRVAVVAACAGAYVAYLVQSLFSIDVPPLAFSGWLLAGCLVALADPAIVDARTRRRAVTATRPRPARRGVPIAAGVASLVLLVPFVADVRLHFAENADRDGDLAAAVPRYAGVADLWPMEAAYQRAAGFAAERQATVTGDRVEKKRLFDVAVDSYEVALDRQPGNVAFLVDLARVQLQRAQQTDRSAYVPAERALGEAIERDPYNGGLRALHAELLNAWANVGGPEDARRRAEAEYEALLELQPRRFDVWIALGRTRVAIGDADGALEAANQASLILPFTDAAWQLTQAAGALGPAAAEPPAR